MKSDELLLTVHDMLHVILSDHARIGIEEFYIWQAPV